MTRFMRPILQVLCGILTLVNAAQAEDQTFQRASIDFVRIYFQQWSSANGVALAYMSDVFPDQVSYFDKTLDHASLMKAKRHFAERWPERHFVERADSLNVTCDKQHLCTVWGLVDWECRSEQRGETTHGTSGFSFQLQDGSAVIAEDGFVVARGQDMARHLPSATEASVRTKSSVPPALASNSPSASTQGVSRTSRDSQNGSYSNADIPDLRAAYFAQSSDDDWIKDWLTVQRKFTGTARSLGSAGVQTLSDASGDDMHVMRFETDHGPIACMMTDSMPSFAKDSEIRIQGTVSIFIDQTMYLAHCSFT
jgi:hypothetical protein